MPISETVLDEVAFELNRRAAVAVPIDAKQAHRQAAERETNPLARYVLDKLVENADLAVLEQRPVCGDTGLPRYYVKIGNTAQVAGGLAVLERSLRGAVARATQDVRLRSNRVHPLTRRNPGNNVGVFAPNIDYRVEPDGDWIDITAVHKGGLFGSDYRMLFPGDGLDGIKRFVLDTIASFHRRGLACPPAIVGVGIGGTKDQCFTLSKEACQLRVVGDRHPDPVVSALEDDLLELCNRTNMGVMGLKSDTPVVEVHCEIAYTHTGGTPVAVSELCTAVRRATARVFNDGRVEYRDDPAWFTPYMRREGIEVEDAVAIRRPIAVVPAVPTVTRPAAAKPREFHLQVPLSEADVRQLRAGDVVYLSGPIFTARDGVFGYMLGDGHPAPIAIRDACNVATTSSPAGVEIAPGEFEVSSLQATAGFRYAKWMRPLCATYGTRAVISKGGMPEEVYAELGDAFGVVFLSTMGYGLGASYGRAVAGVREVHWKEELGISEAMWILQCEELGPLLVEGDTLGNCFFAQHAPEVDAPLLAAYAGLPKPLLSRLGEESDPTRELARG
jgi:L(+)-tartrate dehydratase alpha subunit